MKLASHRLGTYYKASRINGSSIRVDSEVSHKRRAIDTILRLLRRAKRIMADVEIANGCDNDF